TSFDVERDARSSGFAEDVLDAVPPEPERAVDEAAHDEDRGRAIEFGEHRRGRVGEIGVSVVDGQDDGSRPRLLAGFERGDQISERDDREALPAKEAEIAPQRRQVVSRVAEVGIREAVKAEDARGPRTERTQEVDDRIAGAGRQERGRYQADVRAVV